MLTCVVNDCDRPATRGQAWTGDPLKGIEQYRKGIRLELSVKDLAVRLVLCDEHARELTVAAWEAALSKLDGWGWQPLRGPIG
ncbi:hypothetical protein OG777_09130 [Micromonospora peucetia]|uniref:Uncharacterized protein n=1 Tax=Micromonospora peucetia TaxID=47871 RepID=A0A1C6UNQ9_9ACTN|nr:hypothetical protein [Micromonospora peucetia]MCX4387092.1 hypothetical protein [Micromonospora peucetia]WSA34456.1 hypothetical protein OIE14_10615 [Micromonospora peucetia]SCL55543.1 hypothetical protein GA0070608_1506 [Micromonospora peucetia]